MSSIRISGVSGGTIVGVGVQGTGNVVGQTVRIGSLQLRTEGLAAAPAPYADAIRDFAASLAEHLDGAPPSDEALGDLQEALDDLTAEAAELAPDEVPTLKRKRNIGTALRTLALGLARALPGTVRIVAAMTPLAPFAALIGEGLHGIVTEARAS